MATESLTRAQVCGYTQPFHAALPSTLVCTHMPAFISHLGWKLQGAVAALSNLLFAQRIAQRPSHADRLQVF